MNLDPRLGSPASCGDRNARIQSAADGINEEIERLRGVLERVPAATAGEPGEKHQCKVCYDERSDTMETYGGHICARCAGGTG